MKVVLSLSLFAAVGDLLPAQTLSVDVQALAPVTVRAQANGFLVQDVVPAGVHPSSGGLIAARSSATGEASSWFTWQAQGASTEMVVSFQWTGGVSSPPPSFADTSLIDFVVTLTAPSPVTAFVTLHQAVQSSPGSTITATAMDFGNDGSFEVDGVTTTRTLGPITIGAPVPIRVRMQASQGNQGTTRLDNVIHIAPWNDVWIQQGIPAGCAGDTLRVKPSFVGSGIALQAVPAVPSDVSVAVVGLSTQFVSLPPAAANCLLVPSADLLVPLIFEQSFDLPVPAAFRPVGLWVQAVVLSAGGFATTNSFFVVAL